MHCARIAAEFLAMESVMGKALVVYSGGLDSTVLLYKLAAESRAAGALGVLYGQKHAKELEFAKFNCENLGVEYAQADLSQLGALFGKSSLTDAETEVPEGGYREENMKSTVVPNRNMIMISVAAARAIAVGADSVAYAAHSGDHAIYPDCRPEFADALAGALRLCHYFPIGLERPFVGMSKSDIVRLGADLGVDFSKTWSCYKGGGRHCGKCGTCAERKEAFRLAGIPDPTEYDA